MKKYQVEITETLQRTVEVEAVDEAGAIVNVHDQYNEEKIILDEDDFIDNSIEIYKNDGVHPTVFTITKQEVKGIIEDMIKNNELKKDIRLSDEKIKDILSSLECDEFLAKDIQSSIEGSILEVLE